MAERTITDTEIIPQGGKLQALVHWVQDGNTGSEHRTFAAGEFHEAQEWLNDQKTQADSNDQAKSIQTAAGHNLRLVIDQLESVHHSKLKDVIDSLKSAQDALNGVQL